MPLPALSLVLGGAASGKSAFAESLVGTAGVTPLYIATAQVFDDEMAAKVARHRDMRGEGWHTIEEPFDLVTALGKAVADQPVLIDCATLWLTNILLDERDIAAETEALLGALNDCAGKVVIVTNETGQGIVPENRLARQFRNAQGTLNQQLAMQADLVVAVMAGLPLVLKGQLP